MKKLTIVIALTFLLGNFNLSGQKGNTFFGLYLGNNFTFLKSYAIPTGIERDYKGLRNISGGLFISHSISNQIVIGGGLGFSNNKFTQIDNCTSCDEPIESFYEFKIKKFEVPIFIQWNFYQKDAWQFYFYAGVHTNFVRSTNLKLTDSNNGLVSEEEGKEYFNTFIVGSVTGVGLYKDITQRIQLGGMLAYHHDFIDLHKISKTPIRGVLLQVRLNYRF